MNCDFRPTGETNSRGLPKLRCRRAGCAQVCFTRHDPTRIRCACKHPTLLALGEATAAVVKATTLGLVREKPGCGCAQRRKMLNRWLTLPMPNWLVRWWKKRWWRER